MQLASATTGSHQPPRDLLAGEPGSATAPSADPRFAHYKVIRRNGAVVGFEPAKISIAMTKAFLAVNGGQGAASARVRDEVAKLTEVVVAALMKRKPEGGAIHIEEIQDQVELALMRGGEHEVARAYVLYREKRSQERAHERAARRPAESAIMVLDEGVQKPLDLPRLTTLIRDSCANLADVDAQRILKATLKDLYNGVPMDEVRKCAVLAARTLIEKDPAYSFVTARLLLDAIRFEALGEDATQADMATRYGEYFPRFIKRGIGIGLLNESLAQYDLDRLGKALVADRDLQFGYLGLQTLYDRYFLIDQHDAATRGASNCRNASSCASPWVSRSARSIARRAPSSSTTCSRHSTSCRARRRCSIPARTARSCRRATSPRCPTISTASSSRSRTTRSCPNMPAGSATTGPTCAPWARTSRAPTARARAWCRSSRWPTTPRSRSTRAASARARCAPTSRPGTSTSRSSSSSARTPATTAAAPMT